ncbi:MAG: carbohydrate ABC transporter permease [Eubacteriales bacterium]|nr:carbohydrate ABC transporter permease [Eubacteriales bacterium]
MERKRLFYKHQPFSEKFFIVFIYALLALFALLVLLPLLHVLAASLSDPQKVIEGNVFVFPKNPTFKGYKTVFEYDRIMTGFKNSIIYTLLGTLINIIVTLLAAFPLSRKEFRARRWLNKLFMLTVIFNGGMVPSFLLVSQLGMRNTIWAMVIPGALSVWNMMIARSYMSNSIPDELYEAAIVDGCKPFRYFVSIAVPLSKPVIAVLVLYYGVGHWNSYFNALLYLSRSAMHPLQIALRELLIINTVDPTLVTNVQAAAEKQGLVDLLKYSTIVVSSLPVLIIYPFVQKYFVSGVMLGSVKG